MARPRPLPENKPVATSISFPQKVRIAGLNYLRLQPPPPPLKDFSSLVNTALYEYLEKHHPGLIDQTARQIRTGIADAAQTLAQSIAADLAAEPPQAPYGKSRRTMRQ